MRKETNTPYEEFDALLKKVQWPAPDITLESRILAATTATSSLPELAEVALSPWIQRNPLLSFLSVLLALVIGLGSGALSGTASRADSLQSEQSLYGVETQSINHLYFQHTTN